MAGKPDTGPDPIRPLNPTHPTHPTHASNPPGPDALLRPLHAGRLSLRNRVAMGACVTNFALGNQVTQRLIDFHARRAQGGVGMIVSEALAVQEASVTQHTVVAAFDPANDDGLARWAAAVRGAGCELMGQLFHLGRHHIVPAGMVALAPTARADSHSWAVPHAMRTADIGWMVEHFVDAARRLDRAGFSGVELHGAQGFLIAQFLAPSNDRTDGYGGDLAGRLRFVRELLAGIRAACRPGFVVGLKIGADEGDSPGQISHAGAIEITASLSGGSASVASHTPDYWSYSQGAPGRTFDQHVPDMMFPPEPFVDRLPALKAAAGAIPVVGQGRITTPQSARALLASGAADIVGLVRPLIAEPDWVNKVQHGGTHTPCIYCNACWAQLPKTQPLLCVTRPDLNAPDDEAPPAAMAPPDATRRQRPGAGRRVVVVGAGLAGLHAAWRVARLGARVTLFERAAHVGGLAHWQAGLPGRAAVAKAVEHAHALCVQHGVTLRLGAAARAGELVALRPDAVLLATGAREVPMPGLASEALVAASARREPVDGRIVVFDQTQTEAVYAALEALAPTCSELVVLSPRPGIATECSLIGAAGVLRRLPALGVRWVGHARPLSFDAGVLRWTNLLTGVHALPREADDALAEPLFEAGIDVHLIGDANAPRHLAAATHDALAAAATLQRRWTLNPLETSA
jgi:dimethylglycine catabolism A